MMCGWKYNSVMILLLALAISFLAVDSAAQRRSEARRGPMPPTLEEEQYTPPPSSAELLFIRQSDTSDEDL